MHCSKTNERNHLTAPLLRCWVQQNMNSIFDDFWLWGRGIISFTTSMMTKSKWPQVQIRGTSEPDLCQPRHLSCGEPVLVVVFINNINNNKIIIIKINIVKIIRFISGRKASPAWVSPTRIVTEKTSRLLSSYSRSKPKSFKICHNYHKVDASLR